MRSISTHCDLFLLCIGWKCQFDFSRLENKRYSVKRMRALPGWLKDLSRDGSNRLTKASSSWIFSFASRSSLFSCLISSSSGIITDFNIKVLSWAFRMSSSRFSFSCTIAGWLDVNLSRSDRDIVAMTLSLEEKLSRFERPVLGGTNLTFRRGRVFSARNSPVATVRICGGDSLSHSRICLERHQSGRVSFLRTERRWHRGRAVKTINRPSMRIWIVASSCWCRCFKSVTSAIFVESAKSTTAVRLFNWVCKDCNSFADRLFSLCKVAI